MKSRAFTLIELLVVISIIALLISLLLPVLQSTRDEAKRVACLSNTKQMGISVSAYATEYNGMLVPFFRRQNGSSSVGIRWENFLAVYWSSPSTSDCPANNNNHLSSPGAVRGIPASALAPAFNGYAANADGVLSGNSTTTREAPMDPKGWNSGFPDPIPSGSPEFSRNGTWEPMWTNTNRLYELPNLSTTIMFGESGREPKYTSNTTDIGRYVWAHPGGSHSFLFLDMHSEHLKLDDTYRDINMWSIGNVGEPTGGFKGWMNYTMEVFRGGDASD